MNSDSAVGQFMLSVAANLVTSLIILAFLLFYAFVLRTRRQRWMRFKDLSAGTEILTSNIFVREGGTEAVGDEKVNRGFQGTAIDENEYGYALELRDALRPSRWGELIAEARGTPLKQVSVFPCPRVWHPNEHLGKNLILVGSPVYNSGTRYFLSQQDRLSFAMPGLQREIAVRGQRYRRELDPAGSEMPVPDYGVVCRLNIDGRSVFLCFGIGATATCAAVDHLTRRWRDVKAQCGEFEFIALVEVLAIGEVPRVTYLHNESVGRARFSLSSFLGELFAK